MRALVSLVLTAVTVVVQLTIVDRIAFPGGGGPDLVLLLVAALALAGGPMAGVLTGFWAGLALDVAPPGSHFTGQDALVFCLVGYACGLLADDFSGDAEQGHTALSEIVVTAAGAVGGEALVALLGVMLSDPRVSWPAITNVLPAAVAYDVLLCPFVLYAAAAALRLAGVRREGRRPGWSPSQARTSVPATNQGGLAAGSARVKFGGRRREGVFGGSLLGGSVFSGSSSSLGGGPVFGRPVPLGRSSPFRHRSKPMRWAGGGLAGRAPWLSRGGRPKTPGRNWLRGASARGISARGMSSRGIFSRGAFSRGAFGRRRLSQSRLPRLSAQRRWPGRRWGRGGYL